MLLSGRLQGCSMGVVEEKYIKIPLSIRESGECFNCTTRLMDDIKRLKGIHTVAAAGEPCQLQITYDPNFTSLESIENFIIRQGVRIQKHYDHKHYFIENLDCPDCAVKLEQRISKLQGVTWASLNFAASTIWLEYEPEAIALPAILSTIQKAGYKYHEPAVSIVSTSGSTRLLSCQASIARIVLTSCKKNYPSVMALNRRTLISPALP